MHPDPEQLQRFVSGTLDEETADQLADHVEQCPECEQTVHSLESASDTFIDSLRAPVAADPVRDEPECREMIDAIRAFGHDRFLLSGPAAAAATDEPARHLGQQGQYKLLDKLGEGGMGAVYRALHKELDKIVAVKVLSAQRTRDEDAVDRFKREMRTVGKLEHDNIVRALDGGEADGEHFLVMEYVEGADLSQLVQQRGPLPIADACELIRQAAIGLDEAHDHGIVHRDIKPSNLILAQRRRKPPIVKILDMGLARLSEKEAADVKALTSDGQMMGTLDYMAPEQGQGAEGVDIRADVYGLGATLYKLLCGQAPFGDKKYDAPINKLMALATAEPPSIAERRDEVSGELAAVVHKMLAKAAADRYATPEEVAAALVPFCSGANLVALALSKETDVDAPPSQSTTSLQKEAASLDTASRGQPSTDEAKTATIAASRTAARSRRMRVVRLSVALGLFAILLAAAVFIFRTPKGTVTVEIDDRFQGEVSIVATGGGDPIEINSTTGWQVKLKEGTYHFALNGSDDRFHLSKDTLKVKRGKNEVLRVTYDPVVAQVPPKAQQSPTTSVSGLPVNGLTVKLRRDFGKILGRNGGFGVAFSPDGKLLAVGGRGGVRLFDTATGELHRFVNCHNEVDYSFGVAFSPNGLWLASTSGGTDPERVPGETVVCATKDWKVRYRYPYNKTNCGGRLAFSPDGKQLACHGNSIDLHIFDVASGKLVHVCSPDEKRKWGRDVAYSPDGKHILATYREADPHIWNAETGELVQVVEIDASRTYARGAYLSDREIVVEAAEMSYVDNLQTNARKTRDDEFWVLSPDREIAASRGPGLDGDHNVILWSTASRTVLAEITDHTARIRDVAFSPDGQTLVTTSYDETLKIWDILSVQSPDQKIAKEVFALGGTVEVGGQVRVSKIEDLPAEEKVWAIILESVTIPQGFLARMKSLGHPIRLQIGGPEMKDELLSELAGLNIPYLSLANSTYMTGRGLEQLSRTASIRELGLGGTGVEPDDYGLIRSIPGITNLGIGSHMAPSAEAWKRIAEIETLRAFRLWGDTKVVDADLAYLADMEQLTDIVLHNSEISDAGLKHLIGANNLKHLDLTEVNVTAEGVAALRKALPKCEVRWDGITRDHRAAKWVLSVGGRVEVSIDGGQPLVFTRTEQRLPVTRFDVTHVALSTDRGRELSLYDLVARLHRLQSLPKLEHISLQGTAVTDKALAHLANLPSLKYLNISTTKITDQGLQHLKNLSGLEKLYISSNRKITDAGVAHLADMRELTHLDIAETSATSRSMQHVGQMQKLQHLQIHGTYVTDEGLAHLGTLKDLEELQLQNSQVTDRGMAHITGLTKLRRLGLGPEQFTEQGVEFLRQLPDLERLSFLHTRGSDAELERVASFTKLKELQLMYGGGNNLVTDKGMASLAKLSQLETLDLRGTQITDAAVEHLAKLTQLQTLNVSDTKLTVDGVAKLKLALPKCTIQSDFTDDEIGAAMAKVKTTSDESDRE